MPGTRRDAFPGLSEGRGKRIAGSLDELCALAMRLFALSAGAVLLKQGGISRMIASYGMPVVMRSHTFDFSRAPYRADQRYILADARDNTFAQAFFREFGLDHAGAFLRIPVESSADYSLSLVLFGSEPIAKPTAQKLKLLDEVVDLASEEFKDVVAMLADPDNDVTIAHTLDEVKAITRQFPAAAFLLSAKLRIIETNDKGSQITGVPLEQLIGLSHKDLSEETADAVHFLYKHALETLVSPPDFEVVVNDNGAARILRMNVTPFSPTDTRDYFLFVTAQETTGLTKRAGALEAAIDADEPIVLPKDPSQLFLMDTLVRRRTIRQRKQTHFLVLRAWRQAIKSYQISALKALKQNIPEELPQAIAAEIAGEVDSLFGRAGFKAIVPMPCGHSRGPTCLSLEIARALSLITGIPVIQAFISEPVKGVSHPKENTKRPPLKLIRIISEPVLLVDDVATSGSHIEEAVGLLKPTCGAVLPVAWIGGDVAETDGD
ncbi:MAG: PAS domain-containing protein [Rhizobiaceae bacterium]